MQHGISPSHVQFDVLGVPYAADVAGTRVRLAMPAPEELRLNLNLFEEKYVYADGYVNVGVPHYVMLCKTIEAIDVSTIGRHYRNHPALQPWGANVNFVQVLDTHKLRLRTYERGVEAETLACGTGTISSVIVAIRHNRAVTPVHVTAPGGELTVECDDDFQSI